jgi:transcriptional regulator with XRE-family HTH domain
VTLLTPLKRITAFKLSKLPIFAGAASLRLRVERRQSKTPMLAPSDPDALPLTPTEIFEQIGGTLRQWREYYQLSIDDVASRTQIQPRLIQAIEEGHIEMLPELIYVKGMVKRYADNLGLDGTEISHHVPSWEPVAERFTVIPRSTIGFNTTPQIKPFHVYLGYTLAIIGVGAGTSHLLNNAIRPQTTLINTSVVQPLQTAVVVPVSIQLPDVPIGIAVKAPTWAQIGIDGTTKFTGTLKVGMEFNWTAKKQVTINTNNAGGLLFARDGQPLQPLGKIGQKQSVTIKVMK